VGGTICVAVGLGLLVLFTALAATIPEFKKGVIAVSAVPFFLGVGFLIEYRLRRKEIESREQSR
jgi:MFS superfamily sulfate permease-like transporter